MAGGQTISASQAVVVATEAPAARALLGEAMKTSDSKSEEAVGTANLYFRCVTSLQCSYHFAQRMYSLSAYQGHAPYSFCLLQLKIAVSATLC